MKVRFPRGSAILGKFTMLHCLMLIIQRWNGPPDALGGGRFGFSIMCLVGLPAHPFSTSRVQLESIMPFFPEKNQVASCAAIRAIKAGNQLLSRTS
jgi:hypothetical protein